jgi:crossover junction endodeoxyribonuclease RuvC
MRIMGIDPGVARVGFAFVDKFGHEMKAVQYGVIETPAHTAMESRLLTIYETTVALIEKYQPQSMAIEKLFFNTNVTTALNVGQARGVLLLAGRQHGLTIVEYTPLQVKQAITGYGQAEKHQVQEMVRRLLRLDQIPKPDDAADALAIALCQANAAPWASQLEQGGRRG